MDRQLRVDCSFVAIHPVRRSNPPFSTQGPRNGTNPRPGVTRTFPVLAPASCLRRSGHQRETKRTDQSMRKPRIPSGAPMPPQLVKRMQWKSMLGRWDAMCRKDTGSTLVELLVENQIESAKRRRTKKRDSSVSRKKLDSSTTA